MKRPKVASPAERLEQLRAALRAENISYGELADLEALAAWIEPGDLELLEAAGVPEDEAYSRVHWVNSTWDNDASPSEQLQVRSDAWEIKVWDNWALGWDYCPIIHDEGRVLWSLDGDLTRYIASVTYVGADGTGEYERVLPLLAEFADDLSMPVLVATMSLMEAKATCETFAERAGLLPGRKDN